MKINLRIRNKFCTFDFRLAMQLIFKIIQMKSRLFHIAHSIKANFNSFSEALTHAWKVVRLQFALCTQSIVNFKYSKVDGSIREAVGTLETVPMTKGIKKPLNFGILTYFDVVANDWRSCRIDLLIF